MDISSALTFNAVDVETANIDHSSICQIGIVHIRNGNLEEEWETLINPKNWFDPRNISIHGIDEERVQNAPLFPQVYNEICRRVQDSVLVSHGSYDRTALNRAAEEYDREKLQVTWIDSTNIARRTWPRYKNRGYGLKDIARDFGISFKHHDALEDAKTAARIVIEACKESKLDIQGWLRKLEQPRTRSPSQSRSSVIKREGLEDGHLFGETVCFTGELSITRSKAADLAAEAGCHVLNHITRKVTMLVVGISNIDRLSGYKITAKHRKAQEYGIRILSERDFFSLINFSS